MFSMSVSGFKIKNPIKKLIKKNIITSIPNIINMSKKLFVVDCFGNFIINPYNVNP